MSEKQVVRSHEINFSVRRLATYTLLCSILSIVGPTKTSGLTCLTQCDAYHCKEIGKCSGSKVPDMCGCCLECAKQLGESCGGLQNLEGTCDVSLLCVTKPPPNGGLITQDLPGVCAEISKKSDQQSNSDPCKEILCQNSTTNKHKSDQSDKGAEETTTHPVCPMDSRAVAIVDPLPPGVSLVEKCCNTYIKNSCQCLPCSTNIGGNIKCGSKQLPIMLEVGAMKPGNCCDVYRCVEKEEFCKTIQCNDISSSSSSSSSSLSSSSSSSPEVYDVINGTCPDDSVEIIPDSQFDACCPRTLGCQCKPDIKCIDITCPPGMMKRVLSKAIGISGMCCDKFDCKNATSSTCQYDGKTYNDMDVWNTNNCITCQCLAGLTKCFKVECKDFPSNCEWVGHLGNDSCCPLCKGCSRNDKFYENGETWSQDTCITCKCVSGQSYCQAIYCTVRCAKPKVIEGSCCPVCDEEDFPATLGSHCRLADDCDILCEKGYVRDRTGCPMCRCVDDDDDVGDNETEEDYYGRSEPCDPKCLSPKYVLDPMKARKICICNDHQPIKPHHMSTTAAVPSRCKPLADCSRQCLYGYKSDTNGCLKCRCNRCPHFKCSKKCPAGYQTNVDGCQICKCNDSGIFETPFLPGNYHNSARNKGRPCSSANRRKISDGQSWWDGCRRCFCHNGLEMCELLSCPPLRCTNPVMLAGTCCLTCPGVKAPQVLDSPGTCLSSDGRYFVEGETWSLDQCTLCICHLGNPLCTMEACPPVLCHHPVHLANSCCPVCPHLVDHVNDFFPPPSHHHQSTWKPSNHKNKTCVSREGIRASQGDSWRVTPCQSCVCLDGQINCFSQTCPILGCNHTILKKGHCCPTCLEKPVHFCTYDGLTYDNGESWLADDCVTCACMDGHVLCTSSICEPQACPHPVLIPGKCCPECPGKSTTCSHKDHISSFNRGDDTSGHINITLIVALTSVIILFAFIIILGMLAWICIKLNKSRRRTSNGTLPTPLLSLNRLQFCSRTDQSTDEKSVSSSLQPLHSISGMVVDTRQGALRGVLDNGSPIHLGVRKQADSGQRLRLSTGDPTFDSHLSAGISSLTTTSLASLSSMTTKKRLSSMDGSSSNEGKMSGRDASQEDAINVDHLELGIENAASLPPPLPRRPPPLNDVYLVDVVVDNDDLTGDFGFERRGVSSPDEGHSSDLNHSSEASLNYDNDLPALQASQANFFRKTKNYSGNIDLELTRYLLSSSPTGVTPINNRKSW